MKEKVLSSSTGASLRSGKFWCLVKSHNTGVLGSGRAWEEERGSRSREILCKHGPPSRCLWLTGQHCFILMDP